MQRLRDPRLAVVTLFGTAMVQAWRTSFCISPGARADRRQWTQFERMSPLRGEGTSPAPMRSVLPVPPWETRSPRSARRARRQIDQPSDPELGVFSHQDLIGPRRVEARSRTSSITTTGTVSTIGGTHPGKSAQFSTDVDKPTVSRADLMGSPVTHCLTS